METYTKDFMKKEVGEWVNLLEHMAYLDREYYFTIWMAGITCREDYENFRVEYQEATGRHKYSEEWMALMEKPSEDDLDILFSDYGELCPFNYALTSNREGVILADHSRRVVFEYSDKVVPFGGRVSYKPEDILGFRVGLHYTELGAEHEVWIDTDLGVVWMQSGCGAVFEQSVSSGLKASLKEVFADNKEEIIKTVMSAYEPVINW